MTQREKHLLAEQQAKDRKKEKRLKNDKTN